MEVLRQLCYLSEAAHLRQPRTRGQRQRLRVLPQVVGQALQCQLMPLLVPLLLLTRMQRAVPTGSMKLPRLLIRVQRYLVEKTEELVAQEDDE